MACHFEEVGGGQAANLTLPSGMVLPVIAVHGPNGAFSRGFDSSNERVAVDGCFGCGLGLARAWLKVGAQSRLEILTRWWLLFGIVRGLLLF